MTSDDLESLRSQWSTLYSKTLPGLARAKDPSQPRWPVTLDHCFARIVLDNTVGRGVSQWDHVIKKPAVKNMSAAQLTDAIRLGEAIKNGEADLVELDQTSLQARGKGEKKYKSSAKRAREEEGKEDNQNDGDKPSLSPKRPKREGGRQSTLSFKEKQQHNADGEAQLSSHPSVSDEAKSSDVHKHTKQTSHPNPKSAEFLKKIRDHSSLTPYRRRLYSTLLSVPPGHHTTYQAMATFLNSSARAVGNGMRNNPFAPDVPCHRVLASDGTLGGFYGSWGEQGKHAAEKRDLLNSEGVRFDSKGKVKGPVFRDFHDLSQQNAIEHD